MSRTHDEVPIWDWRVIAAIRGECCTKSHLAIEIVMAPTRAAARRSLKRKLERQGWEVDEVVAYTVDPNDVAASDPKRRKP